MLTSSASLSRACRRNASFINGSTIAVPEAPTVPIALRGPGWDFTLMHEELQMGNVTAADRAVSTLFPGATLARLVMVHWHDDGTTKSGRDCSSNDASTGYLTAACLAQFDDVLHWATREAKLWAVVTMRSALAAGDGGPNGTVFDNATLAAEAAAMWGFLAARYRDWDNICGYEVLSEPRADVAASVVHAYHELACGAVWAADPRAACIVGPTRFYNRYHLGPEYLMEPGRPTIYAANFFEPGLWIGGLGAAAALPYGATARCCDLAEEKSCGGSCDGGGGTVTLGRALATLLQPGCSTSAPNMTCRCGSTSGASTPAPPTATRRAPPTSTTCSRSSATAASTGRTGSGARGTTRAARARRSTSGPPRTALTSGLAPPSRGCAGGSKKLQ